MPACKCVNVNVSAEVAEAEYMIVIGAPAGHHTPRVEILQPTQLPNYLPKSSPQFPNGTIKEFTIYHWTYFTTQLTIHKQCTTGKQFSALLEATSLWPMALVPEEVSMGTGNPVSRTVLDEIPHKPCNYAHNGMQQVGSDPHCSAGRVHWSG